MRLVKPTWSMFHLKTTRTGAQSHAQSSACASKPCPQSPSTPWGKGEVLAVARIAGIQAAKKCSDLIPLCHPLALSKVQVDFEILNQTALKIVAECQVSGQTGVEMEALTAASVAALTVYDMCKAIDKGMVVEQVCLLEKHGGKKRNMEKRK